MHKLGKIWLENTWLVRKSEKVPQNCRRNLHWHHLHFPARQEGHVLVFSFAAHFLYDWAPLSLQFLEVHKGYHRDSVAL